MLHQFCDLGEICHETINLVHPHTPQLRNRDVKRNPIFQEVSQRFFLQNAASNDLVSYGICRGFFTFRIGLKWRLVVLYEFSSADGCFGYWQLSANEQLVWYEWHFVTYAFIQQHGLQWNILDPLHWRYNERDGVSNHQPRHCLLKRLFTHRSKKTSTLRVNGLCEGNAPVTCEFSAQSASNAENFTIWWRHHDNMACVWNFFNEMCPRSSTGVMRISMRLCNYQLFAERTMAPEPKQSPLLARWYKILLPWAVRALIFIDWQWLYTQRTLHS